MNSRLLSIALAGLIAAACQRAPDTVETATLAVNAAGTVVGGGAGGGSGAALACSAPEVCFQITTNGANITHVFVDVDACCAPDPGDYEVLVDGEVVTKLHDGGGGPCKDIVREAWFPLQGNQATAEVCLRFNGFVPGHVSVGAKAKDECVASAFEGTCEVCGGGAGSCGAGGAGGGSTTGAGGAGGGGASGGAGGAGGGSTTGAGGATELPIPQ